MQDLSITAIIPLYNGAAFIQESLRSVLNQTLPAAKIIVVDDGSTDNGPDIVAALAKDHDITLVRKENGGQSSARNLGVARSTTPLIALLDQDDVWYPHHLRELVRPFRIPRYPELGWVYSNLDEVDREGRMVTRSCLDSAPEIEHPKRSLIGCLRTDMFVLPSASLISRTAFDAVGGFDERLVGYEDDDLFLRMFRAGYDNLYLRRSLTKWRIFSGSTSYSPRMGRSRAIYLRKLLDSFPPDRTGSKYFGRDLFVPRFFPSLLQEYRNAVNSGDSGQIHDAIADLGILLPYLRSRPRLATRALISLAADRTVAPFMARLLERDRSLVRRLVRSALF